MAKQFNQEVITDLEDAMLVANTFASELGISIQETSAVLNLLITTTGKSSTELAKAFEEILFYLKQISDETTGIDTSELLRYEQACNALNVSLWETQNGVSSLRKSMDILGELSKNYNSLAPDDPRRSELLNSVGGSDSLRADTLDALLRHHDLYTQTLTPYTQETGSLTADSKKVVNSWNEYLTQLSDTWNNTTETLSDSNSLTRWLEQLNKGLSTIKEFNTVINTIYSFRSGIEKLSETFDPSIVKNFA